MDRGELYSTPAVPVPIMAQAPTPGRTAVTLAACTVCDAGVECVALDTGGTGVAGVTVYVGTSAGGVCVYEADAPWTDAPQQPPPPLRLVGKKTVGRKPVEVRRIHTRTRVMRLLLVVDASCNASGAGPGAASAHTARPV